MHFLLKTYVISSVLRNSQTFFISSVKENEETTKDCCKTPDFNSNPCIFYPVKEEVREVLLSATQTHTRTSTPDGSGDSNPTDHKSTDCNARKYLL